MAGNKFGAIAMPVEFIESGSCLENRDALVELCHSLKDKGCRATISLLEILPKGGERAPPGY